MRPSLHCYKLELSSQCKTQANASYIPRAYSQFNMDNTTKIELLLPLDQGWRTFVRARVQCCTNFEEILSRTH
jgi:hypothetical protein